MDNNLFPYCEKQSQTRDKAIIKALADALDISERTLEFDECDDWCIPGQNGRISPGASAWFLMIGADSMRHWSSIKTKLSFMELLKDGDDEGQFCLDRLPTPIEATILREVIGLKKRPALSEAHQKELSERMQAINRSKVSFASKSLDLPS